MSSDPPRPSTPAGHPRGGYLLAVLVLVASLALVALYARSAGERERDLAQARLAGQAEQLAARLRQRLLTYELVSRGGVSLFATVQRPTSRHWRHYIEGLELARRFPALRGLCYAESLSPAQLQDLQLERRAAGEGLFQLVPAGRRPRYGPVVYLEPRTEDNATAIGFDMLSDPARAEAMAAAANHAAARITAPVQLKSGITGLVMYTPVYVAGIVPANARMRESALAGWVCAPISVQGLLAAVADDLRGDMSLRIVDVGGASGEERVVHPAPGIAFPAAAEGGLAHSIEEEVYGRRWRLDFHLPPAPASALRLDGAQGTIAVGLLASLLLFAVALSLARTQSRAQQLAERMSESYRRSELRFRNAMRFSAIGKALLGREGRIVDVNLALANILHTSPEELVGRPLMSYFVDRPGDDDERSRAAGGSVYRVTRDLLREDGELRHVHLTFAQVPGEIGQDVERLVQVEDITDRLRAEARVLALNRTLEARVAMRTRELTRANEELESFAYSVSHDLRAPLRAIDGFSRLLTERYADQVDEAGRDYLARVRAATARMGELIDALLQMARVSRGQLKRVPLDLAAMARDIIAELRRQEPEREVVVDLDPSMSASGDAALVRNLLDNLLGNAWKFTQGREGARIAFTREQVDGAPWFVVRDNGAGFEQAYAGKLFRPFQRLHTQDEFSGHGIGLASVRRIVERHGGGIVAEGSPGNGASFRFTLPDPDPEPDAAHGKPD